MPAQVIQACTSVDQPGWMELRAALWPESPEHHLREMAAFLAEPGRYAQFVAYALDGAPLGFTEAALRTD